VRLRQLVARAEAARASVAQAQAAAAAAGPPSLEALEGLFTQRERLLDLLGRRDAAREDMLGGQSEAGNYGSLAARLDAQAHELLEQAGICPVCGQAIQPMSEPDGQGRMPASTV
jgi:hypothetical protein